MHEVKQSEPLVAPPKWESLHSHPNLKKLIEVNTDFAAHYFGDFTDTIYPDKGMINIKNGKIAVMCDYEKSSRFGFGKNFLKKILKGSTDSERKKINSYAISAEGVTGEITIEQLLPAGWTAEFTPESRSNVHGYCDPIDKIVYVSGDITNLVGIISLLHEIGHARELASLSESQFNSYLEVMKRFRSDSDELTARDLEIILDLERNAWAFSLNTIRPLMRARVHSGLTIPNLKEYVHDRALSLYHVLIAKHTLTQTELISLLEIAENVFAKDKQMSD